MTTEPARRPGMEHFDEFWRISTLFGNTNWWLCTQEGHPFRTRICRWTREAEAEWWAENYPDRTVQETPVDRLQGVLIVLVFILCAIAAIMVIVT